MKAALTTVDDHGHKYTALKFVCPGCEREPGEGGLHMIPVDGDSNGRPSWSFDGNLDAPTLNPSILTTREGFVCHSFLRAGVFEFLGDCTHPLAGQHVPMPDLYEWAAEV